MTIATVKIARSRPRSAGTLAARGRKAGPMGDRRAPRGGARNSVRDLLEEAEEDAAPQWIVLARVEEDFRVVRPGRVDLGERPVLERVGRPVAAVWLREGGPADLEKARAYAAREGYAVFTYPTTEDDPLGRAKRDVAARS